jgi:hypothetical protein
MHAGVQHISTRQEPRQAAAQAAAKTDLALAAEQPQQVVSSLLQDIWAFKSQGKEKPWTGSLPS